jgi:hypothetical protein
MRRREFITLIGVATTWPLAVRVQQAGPVPLVGVLMNFAESDPSAQPLLAAFRSALSKLGRRKVAISGSNFAGAPVPSLRQQYERYPFPLYGRAALEGRRG